jgi:putative transcriptional regulator
MRWLQSFGPSSSNWKGDLMGKKAFDSIMAGLQDALAYTKGDKTRGRVNAFDAHDLDVGKVRGKVGLSQDEFARAFGVSIGTLRNWEQRRVRPDGPARVLLTVIDRDPVSVLKALRIGPKAAASKRRRAAEARVALGQAAPRARRDGRAKTEGR